MNGHNFVLEGKSVAIVGGSSGLGLATAHAALKAGARVCIISRDGAKLKHVQRNAPLLETQQADIRITAQVEEALATFAAHGHIDHVYVSAGTLEPAAVKDATLDSLSAPFDERVMGVLRVVRAAVTHMASGSFTFTSGDLVDRPVAGLAAVTAAAAAVESLAKTLALELAPLRFNVVSPGSIDTPLYTAIFGDQRAEVLKAQAAKLPGKRVGTADEVAQAVLLLMSNNYINASVLHIDGAMRYV